MTLSSLSHPISPGTTSVSSSFAAAHPNCFLNPSISNFISLTYCWFCLFIFSLAFIYVTLCHLFSGPLLYCPNWASAPRLSKFQYSLDSYLESLPKTSTCSLPVQVSIIIATKVFYFNISTKLLKMATTILPSLPAYVSHLSLHRSSCELAWLELFFFFFLAGTLEHNASIPTCSPPDTEPPFSS